MYIYLKKRRLPVFKYLSTSILGFFIVVSGWSITATSQAGTFILLSTQGSRVLMDGNNEYSFKSGGAWSPQWDSDPDSYYNDPVVKDKSVLYKVTIFAMKHINQYPGLIRDKINTGFSGHLAIWIKLFTLFLAFDIITWVLMRGKYKPPSIKMAALSLLCLSVFLLYYFGVSVWFYILISLILGTYKSLSHDKRVECFVHSAPMVILFLNYLLLTVVIFGHPRFTVVIFAFVAIYPAAYGLFLLDKLGRFLFHNYRLVRLGNH
jgi:hypothetical protein